VKQAITGSGKADKKQMQQMIKRLLDLDEIPKPDDAADGLSIALCHINMKNSYKACTSNEFAFMILGIMTVGGLFFISSLPLLISTFVYPGDFEKGGCR